MGRGIAESDVVKFGDGGGETGTDPVYRFAAFAVLYTLPATGYTHTSFPAVPPIQSQGCPSITIALAAVLSPTRGTCTQQGNTAGGVVVC